MGRPEITRSNDPRTVNTTVSNRPASVCPNANCRASSLDGAPSYNEGSVQEHLLSFCLADTVARPVLGRVALVPLEPFQFRQQLGTDSRQTSIRLSYTGRRNQSREPVGLTPRGPCGSMNCHTAVPKTKVALTLDSALLGTQPTISWPMPGFRIEAKPSRPRWPRNSHAWPGRAWPRSAPSSTPLRNAASPTKLGERTAHGPNTEGRGAVGRPEPRPRA